MCIIFIDLFWRASKLNLQKCENSPIILVSGLFMARCKHGYSGTNNAMNVVKIQLSNYLLSKSLYKKLITTLKKLKSMKTLQVNKKITKCILKFLLCVKIYFYFLDITFDSQPNPEAIITQVKAIDEDEGSNAEVEYAIVNTKFILNGAIQQENLVNYFPYF